MRIAGRSYVVGQDRNEPKAVAHLYYGNFNDPGNPMCVRGWNRSDGDGYSIFRNNWSGELCKVCIKRAQQQRKPIESRYRKTKWI